MREVKLTKIRERRYISPPRGNVKILITNKLLVKFECVYSSKLLQKYSYFDLNKNEGAHLKNKR